MEQTKETLKCQIEALENKLSELKTELHQLEDKEQHDAVEHLETYIRAVDGEYEGLKNAWPVFVTEFKKLIGRS
ncbi:MAG: hypothetical protein ACPGYX_09455 [Oceanobacter sp.]